MDLDDSEREREGRRKLTLTLTSFGLLFLFLLILTLLSVLSSHREDLASLVQVPNILAHLSAFEDIAIAHNNSRSVANGYNASAEYVIRTLTERTDQFTVWTQPFAAVTYTELSTPALSQVFPDTPTASPIPFLLNTDFRQPRYGGNGTHTLANAVVWPIAGVGCTVGEYTHTAGGVALVQNTNACDLYTRALSAQSAGAAGLLVWSRTIVNTRVRTVEWTEADVVIQIPVLSVTETVRNALVARGGVAYVNVSVRCAVNVWRTLSVLAETKRGRKSDVVFVGAHLDSVPAGPGWWERERESREKKILCQPDQVGGSEKRDRVERRKEGKE